MRTIFYLFILSIFPLVYGQNLTDYDKDMLTVAEKVAQKIKAKKLNLKVAVWDFTPTTNIEGDQNELGEYISQDFETFFSDVGDQIEVMNRDHFKQVLNEHDINFQGYIDPATAKEIGMFTHADAVITGTIDVGYERLVLRIKIIDTETAAQYAALKAYVTISNDLRVILKNTDFAGIPTDEPRANPSENELNTRTESQKTCETLNTGDYFFSNQSGRKLLIDIQSEDSSYQKTTVLEHGNTLSLLGLPENEYTFTTYLNGIRTVANTNVYSSGQFRVEKCRSFTNIISRIGNEPQQKEEKEINTKEVKNYRICFNNAYSNRASYGDLNVSIYKNGIFIKKLDISNGSERCVYNLIPNLVYSYTYRGTLINQKNGEILIENEKTTVNLRNH